MLITKADEAMAEVSWRRKDLQYKVNADESSYKDGYNEANEWYYVKDKLPPTGETVLLYYGIDIMGKAIMSTGCVDYKGNWYTHIDKEPLKWQKIVLPKENK